MSAKVRLQGIVQRWLPSLFADDRDDDKPVRLSRYGELWVPQADANMFGYAEEGSVLTALSGTIGTGLTGVTAQTAFNDTGPALYVYNNEPAQGGRTIFLAWLKMIASAVATTSAQQYYACVVDPVQRAVTTNNFATLTVNNPDVERSSPIASPTVYFQNNATVSVIAASSSAKKVIGRGALGGLNVIGDEMIIVFGRGDIQAHPGLTAAQATALSKRVSHTAPMAIPPGATGTVHLWGLSQAAAYSPEVELVMVAR